MAEELPLPKNMKDEVASHMPYYPDDKKHESKFECTIIWEDIERLENRTGLKFGDTVVISNLLMRALSMDSKGDIHLRTLGGRSKTAHCMEDGKLKPQDKIITITRVVKTKRKIETDVYEETQRVKIE